MNDLRRRAQAFVRDPAHRVAPQALYRELVTEAPVLSLGRAWLVSGYDEICAVAVSPSVSTDPAAIGLQVPFSAVPALSEVMRTMLPTREGAAHHRLKGLAAKTFSARSLAGMERVVDRIVDDLLREPLRLGHFDVVADLAVPLPVRLTCALLDLPLEERDRVAGWAVMFSESLNRFDLPPAALDRLAVEVGEMLDFIDEVCERRRRCPGPDLISHLVQAQADGSISQDELRGYIVMLFANGLETLTSGVSLAVHQLLGEGQGHPGQVRLSDVAGHPEGAKEVFDECVRLGSPVRASARMVAADVEIGGRRLHRGDPVILLFAAANRDPRRFESADELRPGRRIRHLGFGFGPHHCLGAALSLLSGGAVLTRLAGCSLRPDVAAGQLRWKGSMAINGLDSLPVSITDRAKAA